MVDREATLIVYYEPKGLPFIFNILVSSKHVTLTARVLINAISGHSMTIVGLEHYTNGSRSLLVFDPSYSPCPGIRDLVGVKKIGSKANIRALLQLHRRGTNYLHKYREFELLT